MPKLGRIKSCPPGRVKLRVLEREREISPPFTGCRNGCFIPVGGELVSTPSLTLIVPRDMAESYGGRATTTAWGEGVARHTTLMGVELGNVVLGHLHLGYQIGSRSGPSG
ncbi:hypothetical protein GW17_00008678 [Ensete ventricosum]|nr:hypothetical protein GW17_00008678 [Ensete ventricosum]RZR77175.1 hypothetical protein BHM03_00002185 [Ensete ventricosum]